jgi:hypothetical protein
VRFAIGNDVVDLREPETRPGGRHPRFDARVFSAAERACLRRSRSPERLRWVLWAAKEAAFKAARQDDPTTPFVPRRFRVTLRGGGGEVRHGRRRYRLHVHAAPTVVHVVARRATRAARWTAALAPLARGRGGPSAAVRDLALAALGPRAASSGGLAIEARDRIPCLRVGDEPSAARLSLSHHGRWVAFACAWPNWADRRSAPSLATKRRHTARYDGRASLARRLPPAGTMPFESGLR